MDSTDPRAQVKDILDSIHAQIPDLPTLLALLCAPLDSLGLLPPQYRCYNTRPLPPNSLILQKHVPQIQRVLISEVVPTWDTTLAENNATPLLEQYFCPDAFSNASIAAGEVAMLAYATLVSTQLTNDAMRLLERLALEYPVDRLHTAAFARKDMGKAVKNVNWEDCVRDICMIPAKVANALAGKGHPLPGLENTSYFGRLSIRCEELVFSLSSKPDRDALPSLPSLAYLLTKLVNLGIFPPKPPVSRSQPSFFQSSLPIIRSRLKSENARAYSAYWSALILSVPSSLALQSILTSLFASLRTVDPPLDDSVGKRICVKQEASLLAGLVGKITPDISELWETGISLITGRDWDVSYARIFVCWLSSDIQTGQLNLKALGTFFNSLLELWSSPRHVKHSLISRHRYTTSMLLIAASYLPRSSDEIQTLASNPHFVKGIGIYISHLDTSVRRCGMLVAEVIASLCDKKLDFGDWDGDDSENTWYKDLRTLLKSRDVDVGAASNEEDAANLDTEVKAITTPAAITTLNADEDPPRSTKATFVAKTHGYDSDDSMTGYAPPQSSRSSSPSPSELAEIEKDPSLNVGVKKVPRPVYLAQLGELLRGGSTKMGPDDPHEADRIETALNSAEELIRKKKDYGTELDENVVNLVYALLSLQDNFELPDFSENRQGAMNALVVGTPKKAAPSLIEEFFKNQYSVDQRFVVLNALALGARELASRPVPAPRISKEQTAFPSKTLPAPLHRKYTQSGRVDTQLIPLIMDEIGRQVLEDQKLSSEDASSKFAHERRLRVQKPRGITEISGPLDPFSGLEKPIENPGTRFIDVAAEYFIVPFINRFWVFLRDEQIREERTSQFEGRGRYHGTGTGLILNALVLAQFLRTLAILVNASQNAPEWLAIIAPDALELAVTLGTRPISHPDTGDDEEEASDEQKKEASVLTSALELALVVLSGCLEVDGGRTLGLDHTTLVLGTSEWAGKVFANLEKGLRVQGGGGLHEEKLSKAAAGVLLKIDELRSKWRRSMLDTM